MKFWTKCGKILTEAGKPVLCDNPPCDYYGIFGIKFRYIDQETLEPTNECSWNYYVAPFEVTRNAIQWNEYYSVCLPVNRKVGECLHTKIREGCYDMCDQWDEETGECTHSTESCEFCVEVVVYNLTGCYDTYQELEQAFWTPCGYSSPYPAIWETTYGYKHLTSQASNCVSNYWNQYFCDRYMLNYSITIETLGQCWWEYAPSHEYAYHTYAYCYGGSCEYEEIDPADDCPEGCSKEVVTEIDHELSVGGEAYMLDTGEGNIFRNYIYAGGWWGPGAGCYNPDRPCYHETCYDVVRAYGTAPSLASHIASHVSQKNEYIIYPSNHWYFNAKGTGVTTHTCENSNSICTNFSYESGCHDNYYWDYNNVVLMFRWSRITLNRTAKTPSTATGIKFKLKLTHTKTNSGKGNEQTITTTSESEITINFGQRYDDLPLATDVTYMNYLKTPVCKNDHEYESPDVWLEPYIWGTEYDFNNWHDSYTVKLIGIEYV